MITLTVDPQVLARFKRLSQSPPAVPSVRWTNTLWR
jgi:hypothetical protein